jgi:chromosome segregation ATPase
MSNPLYEVDHTTVGAALAGIAGFWLWLRRRLSSDSKAIQEDTAGRNYIIGLEKELTLARETISILARERNNFAEEVGGLRATVEMLQKTTAAQEQRIKKLEARLGFSLDTQPGAHE